MITHVTEAIFDWFNVTLFWSSGVALSCMPTASAVLYGTRSRSSRTSDTVASSSSSSSSSSSTAPPSYHRRHCRRHPSFLFPLLETKPRRTVCVGESSSQDINKRETVQDLSRRYNVNDRLPGHVLLAKERLRERLRGVSGSEARQSRETSPSFHYDFWVFDADWETSGFQDPPTSDTILNESTSEPNQQQSTSEEAKKKPLGLTKETLKKLRREVFTEHHKGGTQLKSKASNECSICLENFFEGNELVNLSCGHKFHPSCLYPWLRTCGDCPYCRARIILLA